MLCCVEEDSNKSVHWQGAVRAACPVTVTVAVLTPRPCQTHQTHQFSPNSHFFSRSMCKYYSPRPFTALVEVNCANHHCKALITTLVECPSITYKQSHMHTSSQEGEALHISHIRPSTSDAVPRSAYISTGTVAAKQNLNRNSRS